MGLCASKPYYRIVLLGNVGSGKTTFCKQVVDSYLGGFSPSMRQEFRKHIQANILHRLVSLLSFEEIQDEIAASDSLGKNYSLLENAVVADFDYTDDESMTYVQDVLDAAIFVGESPVMEGVVKSMFLTAPWDFMYFKSIRRIMKKDYQPSKEDIFMCRKPTTGHCEYIIKHLHVDGKKKKEILIEIIDVGGQQSERKAWEKQIELADAILYMMSMTDYAGRERKTSNDYYSYLSDDNICNLKHTQELFRESFLIPKTRYIPVVLLETKVDLFRKMIEENAPAMSEIFPDYTGPEENYEAAAIFLRKKITESLKSGCSRKHLLKSKLDRMPILRQNLTNTENFKSGFSKIWSKMVDTMDDMSILERQKGRKSSMQTFMHEKKRLLKHHRQSLSMNGRQLTPSSFRQSIGIFPRKSGQIASIEELISGTNHLSKETDSRKESVEGIVRSKSYHWN